MARPNGAEMAALSVAERVHNATCKVEALSGGDVVGVGSGFPVLAPGLVVTAAHVVRSAEEALVSWASQSEPVTGRVVAMDFATDLAILDVGPSDREVLEVRGSEPRLGEAFILCGYPLGHRRPLLAAGIVAGTEEALALPSGDVPAFALDATVSPGHSGGPVADSGGAVMGLVSSRQERLGRAIAALATAGGDEGEVGQAFAHLSEIVGQSTSSGLGFAVPARTVRAVAEFALQIRQKTRSGIPAGKVTISVAEIATAQSRCAAAKLSPVGPFKVGQDGRIFHGLADNSERLQSLELLAREFLRFKPAGGQFYLAGHDLCIYDSRSGKYQTILRLEFQ